MLTRSSGVTIVCVGPHAIIPPIVHAAKYEPEKSSIFLCGFIASSLFAIATDSHASIDRIALDLLFSSLLGCYRRETLALCRGVRAVACFLS